MTTIAIVKSELRTWTPQQIDEALAEIYGRLYLAKAVMRRHLEQLAEIDRRNKAIAAGDRNARFYSITDDAEIDRVSNLYSDAEHAANVIHAETIPYQVEFSRRGGWTRAYLVQNNGGHVHSSMHCATCFPTTEFGWLTQMSDHTEAEVVELAGEGACSVCYPSAPRVGRNRLELPATIAARAERDAAKAVREARKAGKAIGPIRLTRETYGYPETITTIATAWSTLVGIVANHRAYNYSDKPEAREILIAALVERLASDRVTIESMLETKVVARIKREAR